MAQMDQITIRKANAAHPRHDGATIVERRDGTLLLAWMEHVGIEALGNVGYDHSPCHIASMVSADGGLTWTDYHILVENDPGDTNIHYPSFLRLHNGDILFYYLRHHVLKPGEHTKSSPLVCRSSDDGKTWSTPAKHDIITNGNAPVQLSTGRVVMPDNRPVGEWDWCGGPIEHYVGGRLALPIGCYADHWVAGCCYSDDDGQSWKESESWVDLPLRGVMEPHVAELADGRLLMYLRTQLGAVFQSCSTDGGATWSDPQTTGLRAPESMPCLARIPGTGDLLMVWNDSLYRPAFDHSGKRNPLTAAFSRDEGRTWENRKNLETHPDYEFTNPNCYFTRRNQVIITYVKSKMVNPEPPGKLGRSSMPLKAVVADVEWFYA